jgi:hypothetical protein|tara:strand:+ start:2234 stop:2515 length:282 start_codon:yes stop_codon:yes gene_type:complete
MTLDIIMRIETAIGMSIVKAVRQLAEGELTTQHTIAVLTPIIRGGGNDVSEKEIAKMVWESGLSDAMREVAKVLVQALTAGQDEGNLEEGELA